MKLKTFENKKDTLTLKMGLESTDISMTRRAIEYNNAITNLLRSGFIDKVYLDLENVKVMTYTFIGELLRYVKRDEIVVLNATDEIQFKFDHYFKTGECIDKVVRKAEEVYKKGGNYFVLEELDANTKEGSHILENLIPQLGKMGFNVVIEDDKVFVKL